MTHPRATAAEDTFLACHAKFFDRRVQVKPPVQLGSSGLLSLAEVYGLGKSERFIRDFQRETNTKVKVATKFAPLPWRFSEESPVKALKVTADLDLFP